jgi:hypothetical protein
MCCDGTQQHHNNRSTGQENGSLAIPSKLFPLCIVVECLLPVLQVLPGLVGCCPYSLLSHCFVVSLLLSVLLPSLLHILHRSWVRWLMWILLLSPNIPSNLSSPTQVYGQLTPLFPNHHYSNPNPPAE